MTGIKKYFEDNAKRWTSDGYNDNGYNYPTAHHRVRIVSSFIASLKKDKLNIVDLACGGGDLTYRLAIGGHTMTGIDQSRNMIEIAEDKGKKLPKNIQERVQFQRKVINKKIDLGEKFDVVVAMGFIGYLPNDKALFDIANKLLKPNGYLLVSARNRLFNMVSFSSRTKKEIKNGEAIKLIKELEMLYDQIPEKDVNRFIANFKKIAKSLPGKMSFDKKSAKAPSEKYGAYTSSLNSEPRQSTPEELKKEASECGLKHIAYFGIHPHLIDPNLNKMLPPQIFNKMSGCLEALEHLPVSLSWSSVFIGAFQKKK